MTAPAATPEALEQALAREPIELAYGVTPEEVMRLALDGIDIAYRAHGDGARVSLLAVQADWIMQHLARTEAWAKDEQAKRRAAEDKLVEARSRAVTAEADHQRVTAERDEADRRAGAAEREAESDRESTRKRNSWLHQAKLQAGYRTDVSFDKVWDETLEKAGRADTATAEAASLRAEVEAKGRVAGCLRASVRELAQTADRAKAEAEALKAGLTKIEARSRHWIMRDAVKPDDVIVQDDGQHFKVLVLAPNGREAHAALARAATAGEGRSDA